MGLDVGMHKDMGMNAARPSPGGYTLRYGAVAPLIRRDPLCVYDAGSTQCTDRSCHRGFTVATSPGISLLHVRLTYTVHLDSPWKKIHATTAVAPPLAQRYPLQPS